MDSRVIDLISDPPIECPVCSKHTLKYFDYFDRIWNKEFIFSELIILGCQNCGFGFSWPELPNTTIEKFYAFKYRDHSSPFYINFNKLKRPIIDHQRQISQLLLAKQFVEFKSGDKFLDIGPGDGVSLSTAQVVLDNPTLMTVEGNKGASEAFKKLYLIKNYGCIDAVLKSGVKAKIILMSHSLEHFKLDWLNLLLANLKQLIEKDGVLVIEVPNVDFRIHDNYRIEDSPHFLFFSLDSLRELFKKNGWTILFSNTCGEPYEVWWERLSMGLPNKHQFSFIRVSKKILMKFIPNFIKKIVFNKIYLFKSSQRSPVVKIKSNEYSYGGNRTCLRIVLTL